jgi:protein TonB
MTDMALDPRGALNMSITLREWIARSGALILGSLLYLLVQEVHIEHNPPVAPTYIALLESPPLAEPEPERPPEPPPEPKPEPVRPPEPRPVSRPAPTPVTPLPTTPVEVAADLPLAPVTLPELPVEPAAQTLPPPETPRSNSAAEGRFAQEVRNLIERKKVYPATAKDLGMTGTVEVSYMLDRFGKLQKVEILASSGYPLLDQAALKAVRGANFSVMPEDAWIGEQQKEFRTRLVFSIQY